MPNGGEHHCGYCQHLDRKIQECTHRNIRISATHWTTCRDWNSDVGEPNGPVYSIVCEVKDGSGAYGDIPWYQGNRVDTEQEPNGGDTIIVVREKNGRRHEFPDVAAYLDFWKKNNSDNQ